MLKKKTLSDIITTIRKVIHMTFSSKKKKKKKKKKNVREKNFYLSYQVL